MPKTIQTSGKCHDCGNPLPKLGKGQSGGIGYGTYRQDGAGEVKVCYSCCATREQKDMEATGRATLYWEGQGWVTNWPDTLRMRIRRVTEGKHNLVAYREWQTMKDLPAEQGCGDDRHRQQGIPYADDVTAPLQRHSLGE